jgi:hypothetical protein
VGVPQRPHSLLLDVLLVRGRANDHAAVAALHDERQHAVGEVRLDRVQSAGDEALALVVDERHLQDAPLSVLDDRRVEAVRRKRLGEVAAHAAARDFDLDRFRH